MQTFIKHPACSPPSTTEITCEIYRTIALIYCSKLWAKCFCFIILCGRFKLKEAEQKNSSSVVSERMKRRGAESLRKTLARVAHCPIPLHRLSLSRK